MREVERDMGGDEETRKQTKSCNQRALNLPRSGCQEMDHLVGPFNLALLGMIIRVESAPEANEM